MLGLRARSALLASCAMLPALVSATFSPRSAFVAARNLPLRQVSSSLCRRGLSSDIKMSGDPKSMITSLIAENPVMIFSKSYCPFCQKAKKTFEGMNAQYKALELDGLDNGSQIQDIMGQMTGARSVPRVFIKGQFVGGGDDVVAKAKSGELQKLLAAAGVSYKA